MRRIKIKQYPDGIEITRHWVDQQAVVATGSALLLILVFGMDGFTAGWPGEGPGKWLLHVFPAIAAGVSYYAMCGMLNRSRIIVRQGRISVNHGPLPTFYLVPNVALELSEIQQLSVLRRWHGRGGRSAAGSTYDVFAVTCGRRSVRVVQGISTLDDAEAIKKEIESQLSLDSIPSAKPRFDSQR